MNKATAQNDPLSAQLSKPEPTLYEVDPARLAYGSWCHRREKQTGEGDISASYSAERIGMDQPVRKPFAFHGAKWICVGSGPYGGVHAAQAYRLVHPHAFKGTPTGYRDKVRDGDAARADPMGFYHGMAVLHAKQQMVLCGPPALFIAGQTRQLDLFGGE